MDRQIYEIDASLFTSREEAHAVMRAVFSRSEYIGSSLDALYDVLTSLREDAEIRVTGLEQAEERLGLYARGIKQVLQDAAEENPHLRLVFSDADDE